MAQKLCNATRWWQTDATCLEHGTWVPMLRPCVSFQSLWCAREPPVLPCPDVRVLHATSSFGVLDMPRLER